MEINIHEAKTHLSRLLQKVAEGEEVVISRAGVPVARLVAVGPKDGKRPLGIDRGRIWMAAAILAVAFIGISAINDSEFAYWAQFNTMPPDRGRLHPDAKRRRKRNELLARHWRLALECWGACEDVVVCERDFC